MRATGPFVLALAAIGFLAVPSVAEPPEGWHKSLQEGQEAAARSGKPILLITGWARTL
jgi:hypothetical protein